MNTVAASVCASSLVNGGAPEQHLLSNSSIALVVIPNSKLTEIVAKILEA